MNSIDQVLHRVTKPARYTGNEWNSVANDWNKVDLKIVLAYPDIYEIGMSNTGMAILYDLLNSRESLLAERVYAPWADMSAEMRKGKIPLFSLESKHPLNEFDIIGFSLGYELGYTNVLNMLDLSGIPVLAADRKESFPLVIAGGSCALNPEPMSDFIDLFVLGDGEEVVIELANNFIAWKKNGAGSKSELLHELTKIQGIYVPSLYQVKYDDNGKFKSITPKLSDIPDTIKRRIVPKLPPPVTRPIVPYVEITHNRGTVEIQRGCTRGCRFCQASVIYRPVRERPIDEIVDAVDKIVSNCGYEEISLLSLSTSDYSDISKLVTAISERYRGMHLNLSLPSLRPDAFSVELAQSVQSQRKTSLTFAPEAGTDHLRNVINKGITEDDLLHTVSLALNNGWRNIKLYFMIGLPTETEKDVMGIVNLVREVRKTTGPDGKKPNVRVNVSTFIPKPHTPFQWAGQNSNEDLASKHALLKREIRKTGAQLSWHDSNVSLLEGVLSRGDRKLGKVIHRAWQLGCLFDAWTDQFNFGKWMQAFDECGIVPNNYTQEISLDEPLSWSHIETGVSIDFLKREYKRAIEGKKTPDCRTGNCTGCGLQNRNTSCKELSKG